MDQAVPSVSFWNPLRRMFLAWAVIILAGFIATHFNQSDRINWAWLVLSIGGLVYMKRILPFSDRGSRNVFFVWFGVIAVGMAFSFAAFRVAFLAALSGYLGAFWLVLMALGHALTGMLDGKAVYALTALLQIVLAGVVYYNVGNALLYQHLIAGVVGSVAMGILIRYA